MKKMFKTLATVMCAVLTFGFTSCCDDNEDDIIGTWNSQTLVYEYTVSGHSNPEYNGTTVDEEDISSGYDMMTMVFKDNGKVTSSAYDEDDDGNMFLRTETADYSVEDDYLLIKSHGYTEKIKIDKLDDQNLWLTTTDSYQDWYDDEMVQIKERFTFKFKRVK